MNANESFLSECVNQFGFSLIEANKILEVYKKFKVVKFNKHIGGFTLVSGEFWTKEVMENALKA